MQPSPWNPRSSRICWNDRVIDKYIGGSDKLNILITIDYLITGSEERIAIHYYLTGSLLLINKTTRLAPHSFYTCRNIYCASIVRTFIVDSIYASVDVRLRKAEGRILTIQARPLCCRYTLQEINVCNICKYRLLNKNCAVGSEI